MAASPILHVIAGVNGAGKTSFYRYHLANLTPGAEFVNADEIARERWPGREAEHVVEAAALAATRRATLLDARRTFVAETVFSHESKRELVETAQQYGFRVFLHHIHVASADLARARIATRVGMGGHDVPGAKVEARFERTLRLIPRAAAIADRTYVYDNSGSGGTTHRHVMTLHGGRIVTIREPLPQWVEEAYASALAAHRSAAT
jgi:predicted ABC-type ATPase